MRGTMKPEILARLAIQAADFYRGALRALTPAVLADIDSDFPWSVYCQYWTACFDAAAFFEYSKKAFAEAEVRARVCVWEGDAAGVLQGRGARLWWWPGGVAACPNTMLPARARLLGRATDMRSRGSRPQRMRRGRPSGSCRTAGTSSPRASALRARRCLPVCVAARKSTVQGLSRATLPPPPPSLGQAAGQRRVVAVRDNSVIYVNVVPPVSDLPEIPRATLAKVIFPPDIEVASPDMWGRGGGRSGEDLRLHALTPAPAFAAGSRPSCPSKSSPPWDASTSACARSRARCAKRSTQPPRPRAGAWVTAAPRTPRCCLHPRLPPPSRPCCPLPAWVPVPFPAASSASWACPATWTRTTAPASPRPSGSACRRRRSRAASASWSASSRRTRARRRACGSSCGRCLMGGEMAQWRACGSS